MTKTHLVRKKKDLFSFMTVKLEIFTLKGKEVLVLCSGGIEREGTGNSCEPLVLRSQFFFWYFAKKESFRI